MASHRNGETSHTILIPTKDRPRSLKRAVASAVAALGERGEILVIDDHGSIRASETLASFNDPRLRIVENEGRGGAASARNFGISRSRGEVIFLLDDDDELISGYCSRVLSGYLAEYPSLGYGFSAYLQTVDPAGESAEADSPRLKARMPHGVVPHHAPLGKRLCGFGFGFWIRRSVLETVGEIDEDFTVQEDTDYVCRLIGKGVPAWYSSEPGVVIHSHGGDGTRELGHLTQRVSPAEKARCLRRLCAKHPAMIDHLGVRYLKHLLRSRLIDDAWAFANGAPSLYLRAKFTQFILVKYPAYALRGKVRYRRQAV